MGKSTRMVLEMVAYGRRERCGSISISWLPRPNPRLVAHQLVGSGPQVNSDQHTYLFFFLFAL